MTAEHVEIVDIADQKVRYYFDIPAPAMHWLREHSVHDLKSLLIEMHESGEDVTEYGPVVEELEHLEKKWKLSGDLTSDDEGLDPLEYVQKEMETVFV